MPRLCTCGVGLQLLCAAEGGMCSAPSRVSAHDRVVQLPRLVCAAAGLEGLTDVGLLQVSSLQHLTRLCVEAEETTGISLASLAAVRRLHRLKKLHWCSRDSLHGPMDTDLLTAQLSGLTGLRQLVLLVAPDSPAYSMSGWRVVLQRRLPLCRLVCRREMLQLDAWGDVPEESAV